jgi:polar amino acid transport system permease protein
MSYSFNWSVLWTGQAGGWLIQGILTTLHIFVLGLLIALALGIVAGALRTMPLAPLRWVASAYVEFFRNVPLLVWMFFGTSACRRCCPK